MCKDPIFLAILLVLIAGYPSTTTTSSYALFNPRMILTETKGSSIAQGSSPAPSPRSGGGKSGDSKPRNDVPVDPKGSSVSDECLKASEACRDGNKLSACLVHSGAGSKDAFLILQNGAGTSLTVKVLYAPANVPLEEVILGKQFTQKVNVTKQIVGSSFVVLNAGSGECVIHISSPVSGPHFEWQFPYAATVNPMHGVYLLFGTAVIVGGIWTCCKFGKSRRWVNGIPYQELEMGQTDVVSANDEETAEGWDENWDDNWDEIREVKPPSSKAAGNSSANGMASNSAAAIDRYGWEDNWE